MNEQLQSLASKVVEDPYFLAAAFEEYKRIDAVDDVMLGEMLGCQNDDLVRLKLCRRPRMNPELFRRDVIRISSRFEIDPFTLFAILRRVDAVSSLRRIAPEDTELLMAARDRHSEPKKLETDESKP